MSELVVAAYETGSEFCHRCAAEERTSLRFAGRRWFAWWGKILIRGKSEPAGRNQDVAARAGVNRRTGPAVRARGARVRDVARSHWSLAMLREIGYPAGDESLLSMREQVLDHWMNSSFYMEFESRALCRNIEALKAFR